MCEKDVSCSLNHFFTILAQYILALFSRAIVTIARESYNVQEKFRWVGIVNANVHRINFGLLQRFSIQPPQDIFGGSLGETIY